MARTAPTQLRQALLSTAAQYVGYPYVLYGTPPEAFDCSAYTWWVYKQNGINIPRTVRDQRTFVTPVTNPQPGDLIFYKNYYHVGIYADPGMTYEAQNPQSGVIYGKIWDRPENVWYGPCRACKTRPPPLTAAAPRKGAGALPCPDGSGCTAPVRPGQVGQVQAAR